MRSFKPFETAYDLVTHGLRAEYTSKRLTSEQQVWFEQLIKGFHKEFAQWQDPKFEAYWALWDHKGPLVQLALCAFFHMVYDLPRVIADSLHDKSNPNDWAPAFHDADHTILRAFVKSFRGPGTVWTALESGSRPLVGNLFMRAFAFHIVMLRNLAWRWGIKLASAKKDQRLLLESKLFDRLVQVTAKGLQKAWLPPKKIDCVAEDLHQELRTTDFKEAQERPPLFLD